MAKFPDRLTSPKYLRNAWSRATYAYLARFFRTVCFSSEIEAQDGIPLRDYCYDPEFGGWRLPMMGGSTAVSGATWSGVVWYIGNILYDFNNTSNSPTGSARLYGLVGVEYDDSDPPVGTYRGSVLGEYLKINLRDGSYEWADGADILTSIDDIDDKDEFDYFRVATISNTDGGNNNIYELIANRTVGDIRINYAPYVAEIEEAQ